jgi:hypothetical protein
MVFKGGTSLSKVFNLIKRFSEDVDISINFLQDYGAAVSKTQASKLREEIEANLQKYKDEIIVSALKERGKNFDLTIEPGDTEWEIHVNYKSVLAASVDYIKPRVKIELSGRNETEPSTSQKIRPYLAEQTEDLQFPEPTIDALLAERTFWEKVTLIHAELHKGTFQETADRMSRHWSDLSVLMKSETGRRAIKDNDLCLKVVDHKAAFWRDGKAKYDDCRNKKFWLVPTGQVLEVLKDDYNAMVEVGMFYGGTPASFEEMMKDVAALEGMLNGQPSGSLTV